jgi:hypothetical protein
MGLLSRMGQQVARRVIWPSATCVLQSRRGCICQDRPSARPRRVACMATAVPIQNRRCCACNKPLRRCSIFRTSTGQSDRFEAFAYFLEEMRPGVGRSGKARATGTGIAAPPEESLDGFAGGQALAAKVRPPGIQACRYDNAPLQPVIAMIKERNLPANVHENQTVVSQCDTMRTIAGPRTKKTPAPGRGSPTGRCI